MAAAAIVPIKRLSAAKSRLSGVLTAGQREDLVLCVAARVLGALESSGLLSRVYVVTPDPIVAEFAKEHGAAPVFEHRHGLNAALAEATREVQQDGMDVCLIAFGDLPLLSVEDIVQMFRLGSGSPGVVAAPDRHGRGTNALLLRPPTAVPFLFGTGSYTAFRDATCARGLSFQTHRSIGTGFDLDTPADLYELPARSGAWDPRAADGSSPAGETVATVLGRLRHGLPTSECAGCAGSG